MPDDNDRLIQRIFDELDQLSKDVKKLLQEKEKVNGKFQGIRVKMEDAWTERERLIEQMKEVMNKLKDIEARHKLEDEEKEKQEQEDKENREDKRNNKNHFWTVFSAISVAVVTVLYNWGKSLVEFLSTVLK